MGFGLGTGLALGVGLALVMGLVLSFRIFLASNVQKYFRQDFRNGTPPNLYILHTKLFYILLRMLF